MAVTPFQPELAVAPIDSARVVAEVYSVSLLATLPIVVAVVAAVLLRRSPAGTHALVWRAAVTALLAMLAARLLPAQWVAWVVPAGLAEPLIELGRVRVASGALDAGIASGGGAAASPAGTAGVIQILSAAYWTGVAVVLLSLARGWIATRRLALAAAPVAEVALLELRDACAASLGLRRPPDVRLSGETRVPLATGVFVPRLILPVDAPAWPRDQLRAALLHEMAHVRAWDVGFRMAARLACALLWFHPCAWWIARQLRAACELACDDRVLAGGVRPSVYGSLLLRVAGEAIGARAGAAALALSARDGLRQRLAEVVAPARDRRGPGSLRTAFALSAAAAFALPLGLVDLAPTHGVLQRLMRDSRWESRAVAVLGLAPRPDSVAVARAAAANDPDPMVRAWASYALGAGPQQATPQPPTSHITAD